MSNVCPTDKNTTDMRLLDCIYTAPVGNECTMNIRWPSRDAYGDPRGAADAHDAGSGGAHHEHQLDRLGTAEKICETTARRRVYKTAVGRSRGAADAHDAGPGH